MLEYTLYRSNILNGRRRYIILYAFYQQSCFQPIIVLIKNFELVVFAADPDLV